MNLSELFESRKQFLDNLVSLLLSDNRMIDESLSISIDAGWGYGKTFFLNHLEERLKSDKQMVVRFNAWETDLSNDAFISFADSLFTQLAEYLNDTRVFFEKADLAMVAFGSLMIDKFVSGLPLIGKVKKTITETREKYQSLVENEGSYFVDSVRKSGLELVKEKVCDSLDTFFAGLNEEYHGKNVIILVDELDRCRPDYSIQVLERVKHLFGDIRLSFVFAINKKELEKSIMQTYGSIDTSVYFEKIFTFSFRLPQFDVDSFFETDITFCGNELHAVYYDLLVQMIKDSGQLVSLRQVDRLINYFDAVCKIVPNFDDYTKAPYMIPIAVFSKVLDNDFFHDVFEKKKLSNYYSMGGKNTVFRSLVYEKFRVYVLSDGSGTLSSLFPSMSSTNIGISRPGFYESSGKKYKLSNSQGNDIQLISSADKDMERIYHLVDCLS